LALCHLAKKNKCFSCKKKTSEKKVVNCLVKRDKAKIREQKIREQREDDLSYPNTTCILAFSLIAIASKSEPNLQTKVLYKASKFLVRNHNNQQHKFSKIQPSNLHKFPPTTTTNQPTGRQRPQIKQARSNTRRSQMKMMPPPKMRHFLLPTTLLIVILVMDTGRNANGQDPPQPQQQPNQPEDQTEVKTYGAGEHKLTMQLAQGSRILLNSTATEDDLKNYKNSGRGKFKGCKVTKEDEFL
jgi:hypothetical protein